MKSFSYLFLFFTILAYGCQSGGTAVKVNKDEITAKMKTAEDALYGNKDITQFDKAKAGELAGIYATYSEAFPEDENTASYLFKAAELQRSLRDFPAAIKIYDKIYKNYPNYEKTPHSLFLLGFSYENDLKQLDKAKSCYEDFLKKYPKHELADDVEFSLKNLGKSPEDIIKEFEARNKAKAAAGK